MHVLYFHQYFSTPSGSSGTRSYEMARALVEKGHSVTMVCGSSQLSKTELDQDMHNGVRSGLVDGINVVEIDLEYSNHNSLLKRSLLFLQFAWRSIGIARKTDYDVLFATTTPLTAGLPGIFMRLLKPGKPFVFEVRDLWPELPKAMGVISNPVVLWAMGLLETISYKTAHHCIALSPGIQQGILKKKPKAAVSMIPNGCDLEFFSATERGRNNKLKAVFTGAHGQANGLDAVLNAAAELKRRNDQSIELHFIGDGKLKPELVSRAKREQLDNCVFLDPVPKKELRDQLAEYDVGLMILANVSAFYYGTSPNKFFDYLACGLPVLNNYPGWLSQLISENDCGIAIAPDDAKLFADALQELASDPDRRIAMGRAARQLGEEQFNRARLAASFIECLEAVHTNQT
ncbi:MAG: glycosyltransferase family 4 protein [Pseudomonadota bacterium]